MTIDDLLEKLLRDKDVYDETEVEEEMQKWTSRNTRRNALYNIGLNKKIFNEQFIDIATIYCSFSDHINEGLESFVNKVSSFKDEKLKRLVDLSHFYYVQCKDPKIFEKVDDSLKLIVMSSLIESLLANYSHKEFIDWYNINQNNIPSCQDKIEMANQINCLWNEYKKEHGAHKKFRNFFEQKLNEEEQNNLLSGFSRFDYREIKIDDIARWLYQMRSDFVHNASLVILPEINKTKDIELWHIVNGIPLTITININLILDIFEKGFLRHFGLIL